VAFFLGIDGGGSKTRCLLGDEKSVLGSGTSSGCNVVRVGEPCAQDALASAVHGACVQAGISPREITRTCLGAAGGVRKEIAAVLLRILKNVAGGELEVTGDVQIAFEDAFDSAPGIIVIAGTGSIAYGRNSKGATARAGGWGYAVSDEGSGHWVGVEAVRAALHARDRGENCSLLTELSKALGVESFEQFIVCINGTPSPDFSSLFPVVLSAAENGDGVAAEILEQAGTELASLAGSVAQRLFPDERQIAVACHGGVLGSSPQVRKGLARELKSAHPGAEFITREIDPARGALQRARSTCAGSAGLEAER
jgi:glucosamine kinase